MNQFKRTLLSSSLCLACSFSLAYAQQPEQLEQIDVSGNLEQNANTPNQIGESVKGAKKIAREQTQSAKDLVRYETGITMVEAGRFGNSGFTMRGVDENRVAINVDGLKQAETLSSQGFKELFEGYGNFNNTRNSVEVETLKQVHFTKGADSIKTGSGALGGSVIYTTKDARDYLLEKDYFVGYKRGYATENNQNMQSLTAAGRYKGFDALIVQTHRRGHELENYDYKNADPLIQGKRREKTDPYVIKSDSTLLKFAFNPTENHRFSIAADLYEHKSKGEDLSYTLKYQRSGNETPEVDSRHTNDKTKRRNLSFTYENFTVTPFWDSLKLTYSNQKIKTRARTDEYCDGEEKCLATYNPLGIKLENGKVVRKDGSDIQLKNKDTYIDTDNSEKTEGFNLIRGSEYWFDCALFDCSKPMDYWSTSDTHAEKKSLPLDDVLEQNGKKFARNSSAYSDYILLPTNSGYLERLWQERDLDTNTKQINLDLTKEFNTFKLEHNLQYGAAYNQIEKQMTNRAGNDASNVHWWANKTLGKGLFGNIYTCEDAWEWSALLCPRVDPEFSYLLPIKTKGKSVYLLDNLRVNDYLSFDLGYRYDNIHFNPHYSAGKTPKLPDDLVKGLFIPVPKGEEYAWWPGHFSDPTPEQIQQNIADNIHYLANKNKKYKAHSYAFTSTIDPTDYLRLQLKYSKGFRAPTADEMYFTFKHPDFTILPNLNLEPEIAKTKEIALTLHHNDWGFISTSLFKTNYTHFIDLSYLGRKDFAIIGGGNTLPFSLYQNINRQNAKVTGIEINGKLFFGKLAKVFDGFNVSYKYTYQKGRMENHIPMNAIQPKTSIYGLGYQHPNDKFGVDLYITHASAKKAEDTYNLYYKEEGKTDSRIKWRSTKYTVLDLMAYVKPIKHLTLQAGIYNLTNQKYLTWESARSIRPFGTSNVIEQNSGAGIYRFYAPGRNYRFNASFEF